jgi:hypothetical protein
MIPLNPMIRREVFKHKAIMVPEAPYIWVTPCTASFRLR